MSPKRLKHKLTKDLLKIGLPVSYVDLEIRGYSKTKYGVCIPAKPPYIKSKVYIYPYYQRDSKVMFPYDFILYQAIHEMCHHLQFSDYSYIRVKGVMHDEEFWRLFNYYRDIAVNKRLLKGDIDYASFRL